MVHVFFLLKMDAPSCQKYFLSLVSFFPVTDVLNVSGKFNSDELSRDMSVGDDVKDEPFFEQREGVRSPQNVSALIGKTAFLSCIVRNLGKAKSVSNLTNPCLWVLKLPHYNLWS